MDIIQQQSVTEQFAANNLRFVRESLYDTFTVGAATAMGPRIILFGDPANSGKGATYPELTNMTAVGQLTFPQRMTVYAFRVIFLDMLSSDVQAISKKFVARLWVSGTVRCTLPLTLNETPKIVSTIASDIIVQTEANIDLPDDYSVDIAAGQPFFVELIGSAAYTTQTTNGRGATIRVQLEGLHGYPL